MAGILIFLLLILNADAATDISNCTVTNSPGSYQLNQSFTNFDTQYCLHLNSSDIFLNCSGYNITGNISEGTHYGMWASPAAAINNVTVMNCNFIDWYNAYRGDHINNFSLIDATFQDCHKAIYVYRHDDINLTRITVKNSTADLVRLMGCDRGRLRDIIVYEGMTSSGSYGLSLTDVAGDYCQGTTIENLHVYNSSYGYININTDGGDTINITNLTLGYAKDRGQINWIFVELNDTVLRAIPGEAADNIRLNSTEWLSLNISDADSKQSIKLNVSANITLSKTGVCASMNYYWLSGFPKSKSDILAGSLFTPNYISCSDVTDLVTFEVDHLSGYTTQGESAFTLNNPSDGATGEDIIVTLNVTPIEYLGRASNVTFYWNESLSVVQQNIANETYNDSDLTNPESAFDQDWDTFAQATSTEGEFQLNYTWRDVWDSSAPYVEYKYNFTLGAGGHANLECWDYASATWAALRAFGANFHGANSSENISVSAVCLNSTNATRIRFAILDDTAIDASLFYEIRLWWTGGGETELNKTEEVASGDSVSYNWSGLSYDTTYYWHVVGVSGGNETTGGPWNFTTKSTATATCGDIGSSSTLTGDLSSNGTCITITADSVRLDCAGYSITGNGTGIGINITGYDSVILDNCTVSDFDKDILLYEATNVIISNTTLFDFHTYNSTNISVHLAVTECSYAFQGARIERPGDWTNCRFNLTTEHGGYIKVESYYAMNMPMEMIYGFGILGLGGLLAVLRRIYLRRRRR